MINMHTSSSVEKQVDEILDKFKDFTSGTRVVMLMHRNKEGGKKSKSNYKSPIKRVTTDAVELRKVLHELLEFAIKDEKPWRLYMTANARSLHRAIRLFKHRQLDTEDFSLDDVTQFYLDIKNRWISCLMHPTSKIGSVFLFDCDSTEELEAVRNTLKHHSIQIDLEYSTKNGWHVITAPHNPQLTTLYNFTSDKHSLTASKDALLLLWWK